jgi:deoxyguanosine kinase
LIDGEGHPFIAIEGVIGVGKTTLARLLQPRFGKPGGLVTETILEAFDENPFLSDFYGDRTRYAFQTQLFFLLSRYRQQQVVPNRLEQGVLLSDYVFEKDRMFAHLNIQGGDELEMYDRLYEALAEKVRPPDLVVYLRARIDTLMARIARRDRTYERQMDRDYIAALREAYEQLFASYDAAPLLVIESDAMDFVQNPDDLDIIERRIHSALAGVRQPTLPRLSIPTRQRAREGEPSLPAIAPRPQPRQQAMEAFLVLAEAVGRVGGALAVAAPDDLGRTAAPVDQAIRDAHHALSSLAERAGVRLEE